MGTCSAGGHETSEVAGDTPGTQWSGKSPFIPLSLGFLIYKMVILMVSF